MYYGAATHNNLYDNTYADSDVPAQQKESSDRPSVGLMLGGSDARGAAHLGVIRVLEENRIPIDYIAGTSIVSFVGGRYSTGKSVDEIRASMEQMTWSKILVDRS